MVLRADAVRARLLKLEEVVSKLEALPDPDSGPHTAWAVERGLQLGAEIVFDIGNHVLSAHFGTSPEGYEDILEQLGVHGVIDKALRERLRGLGGFRNILVHDYLRLDPLRLSERFIAAPRDFSDFGRALGLWLEGLST